jgi:hypothetical protein
MAIAPSGIGPAETERLGNSPSHHWAGQVLIPQEQKHLQAASSQMRQGV